MVDLRGKDILAEEIEMLKHPLVGGVILFTRNYESPEQIAKLVSDIHGLREPHLLVGVDHEGGRVQRFREGFTVLPSVTKLGLLYNNDAKSATALAEQFGWLMAIELRSVGVDFSFAPVLDLDRGISDVMVDRTFHTNPETVGHLAYAFVRGMKTAGMVAVGKHFPGHGAVKADSHIDFPVDRRDFETIQAEDIQPFTHLIKNGLAGIMPAHVIYLSVDSQPAGYSPFWIREVLRGQLGFQGVVFSDDLSMKAASVAGDVVDRANAAIRAGCDMALVCNDPDSAISVLDGLAEYNDPVSHVRLARMHGKHFVNRAKLLKDPAWHKAVNAVNQLRT